MRSRSEEVICRKARRRRTGVREFVVRLNGCETGKSSIMYGGRRGLISEEAADNEPQSSREQTSIQRSEPRKVKR